MSRCTGNGIYSPISQLSNSENGPSSMVFVQFVASPLLHPARVFSPPMTPHLVITRAHLFRTHHQHACLCNLIFPVSQIRNSLRSCEYYSCFVIGATTCLLVLLELSSRTVVKDGKHVYTMCAMCVLLTLGLVQSFATEREPGSPPNP